jgi:hypothetical protein
LPFDAWHETIDPEGVMKVRPGAVVRSAGVTVACFVPDRSARSRILVAAFSSGWFLNKPGLGVYVVVPDDNQPWKRATVPCAKSVSLWSFAMLAATSALRRTRLPTPISAVVLGGGMLVADSLLTDLGESRRAATTAQAQVEVQSSADDEPGTVGAQQLSAPEEVDVAP